MRRLAQLGAVAALLLAFTRPSGALESQGRREKNDPYQRLLSRVRRDGQLSAEQLLSLSS